MPLQALKHRLRSADSFSPYIYQAPNGPGHLLLSLVRTKPRGLIGADPPTAADIGRVVADLLLLALEGDARVRDSQHRDRREQPDTLGHRCEPGDQRDTLQVFVPEPSRAAESALFHHGQCKLETECLGFLDHFPVEREGRRLMRRGGRHEPAVVAGRDEYADVHDRAGSFRCRSERQQVFF